MPGTFLHGIETIEVSTAGRAYNVVKSGVIGLIGIAPKGPANQNVLVLGSTDASQFGSQVPGFTIPQALDVILKQGAATVIVINVFDETAHTTAVTAEVHSIVNRKLKLDFAPIGAVTVLDNAGSPSTLIAGTDYSIDEYGVFTALSSLAAENTSLKFTYKKLNASAVTGTSIIGANTSGVRTGSKVWELAYNQLGFNPKILIAPGFTGLTGVASELIALAKKYRAITYIDAPAGTTVQDALAGRGPSGTIGFYTSERRVELLYPNLKKYDPATNTIVNFPYSAFKAGIRAAVDADNDNGGFWVSDSNREIICEGVERAISASLTDSNAENQTLNAAGITTVFNTYGTGIRTWGNRNASFPVNSDPKTFMNVVRTDDIVSETMELAALAYVDRNIIQAFIDVVREEGNAFIRTLIGRGALLPGSKVIYNPDKNPADQLAAGHITFTRIYMVSTPAERITFESVMDINLLTNLK